MLQAGIPLVQAFDIVAAGHENPGMQKLLSAIKVDLESGTTLADALAKHPLYFDDLFVNLVNSGEQSGALENPCSTRSRRTRKRPRRSRRRSRRR
jgi:type IV pilus assembly protein PilC